MTVIDIYNTKSKDLKEGDVGLLIVKVMIHGPWVTDGNRLFTLYRCPCPQVPGYEMQPSAHEPQGDKLYGSAEELKSICLKLYPGVIHAGIQPSPDTII